MTSIKLPLWLSILIISITVIIAVIAVYFTYNLLSEENSNSMVVIGDNTNIQPKPNNPIIQPPQDSDENENADLNTEINQTDESIPEVYDLTNEDLAFNMADFLPAGAGMAKTFPIDLEGDATDEYVLTYFSNDNIGNGQVRQNQHLKVFKYGDNGWQVIKEDVAAQNNTSVDMSFANVQKVNLGNDLPEELYVSKVALPNGNKTYYVFAYQDRDYQDLSIPKGYLHSDDYIGLGENFMSLLNVEFSAEGITENYVVFCDGTELRHRLSQDLDKACRKFSLFHEYDDGDFKTEIIN